MPSFFERYRQGEYQQVWRELQELGSDVRKRAYYNDACAVAEITMARVHENLKTIVKNLQELEYQFGVYPDGTEIGYQQAPLIHPGNSIKRLVSRIESRVGALPISLRTFWETIGSVNLIGTHPDLPAGLDPLVVFPPDFLLEDYTEWCEYCNENDLDTDDGYEFLIAPNDLHKDNLHEGEPYVVILPDATTDALMKQEAKKVYFVDYLRHSIGAGGLPGLAINGNEQLKTRIIDGVAPF